MRATELAPTKPYGFAALSLSSPSFAKRMSNLTKAIELSNLPQHAVARAGLLVRFLVEPRQEEAQRIKGEMGPANPKHPIQRDLSPQEESLYAQICETIKESWAVDALHDNQKVFLATQEYRLGVFFRKKHRDRSRCHFLVAYNKFPPMHRSSCLAQFWLATMATGATHTSTLKRCPKEYVIGLYSSFAPRFDTLLLESLQYSTPIEIRKLVNHVTRQQLETSNATVQKWADKGADLGCGTGLSGKAFRDCVDHFTGVDLSPDMLAQARARRCYDKTVVGDCSSVLTGQANFDLILACDVFVYIGDLKDIFAAASESLTPKGLFAFSTELLEGAPAEIDYVLHESARFAHSIAYIERLAGEVGLKICGQRVCTIRKNQGKDVRGYLVVLQKDYNK